MLAAERLAVGRVALTERRSRERIGWNPEQLKPLKDEYAKGTAPAQGELDGTMFTCDVLVKANQRVRSVLAVGERAAAQGLTKNEDKNLTKIYSN